MSAFVPKKKVLPLKFPLAAGKQGMAPSRCVYGFRQECVLKKCIRNALRAGSYSVPWLLKVIKMVS